jgi:ATP-dependent DNA helicase DinG
MTTVAAPKTFAEAEQVLAQALPGYESRPQQKALATFVEKTLADGGHGLAEAGCGTGKSLGSMIPAILSGKRTVVATATIALMEQYANKDVPFLQEHLGVEFKWALLKGRSNYFCVAKANSGETRIDPDLLAAMEKELSEVEDHSGDREHFTTVTVTKEDFAQVAMSGAECPGKSECPFGDVCFAEKAKAKAREAQVVVTNTAMLMTDLKVREATDGFAAMLGEFDNLIIDEAHELEEIATAQLEEVFRPNSLLRLVKECNTYAGIQGASLDPVVTAGVEDGLAAVLAALPDPGKDKIRLGLRYFAENFEPYAQVVEALRALHAAVLDVTIVRDERRADTRRAMLSKRIMNMVARFEGLVLSPETDVVRWVENEERPGARSVAPVLHFAPINVAPFLTEWLWNRVSAVLVSATMSVGGDFSFIRTRLGLTEAQAINVGTPFDYDHQAMLFVPPSEAPNPKTPGPWMSYSNAMTMELIRAAQGGALLLFTSRTAMNQAYNDLGPQIEAMGLTVLAQGKSGSNKDIARVFAEDTHSVLFALKSFFTGVDIQGEACRLVIINKLPFPVPSEPVFQARGDVLRMQGKSDFSDLSMPLMTLTLTQGFGRLIRTLKDRGVVAILDSRLSSTGYGKQIVRNLPPCPRTTDLNTVRAFYAR